MGLEAVGLKVQGPKSSGCSDLLTFPKGPRTQIIGSL